MTRPAQKKTAIPLIAIVLGAVLVVLVVIAALAAGPDNGSGTVTGPSASTVHISEYMSANDGTAVDSNGACSDWIELHNTGGAPVSLHGYTLVRGGTAAALPDLTVPANGYAVVFCDGVGRAADTMALRLSAGGGDTLLLKDSTGAAIEQFNTILLDSDISAVRQADGAFARSAYATPGFANDEQGLAALTAARTGQNGGIVLSEIMAACRISRPDGDGDFCDYIEVANLSDKAVDLTGYSLSDSEKAPYKWQFPSRILAPGEVALVVCGGKSGSADASELHAPFRISASEATVCLSDAQGRIVDKAVIKAAADDCAYVRGSDGSFTATYDISPAYPNTKEGVAAFRAWLDTKRGTGLRINEYMTRNNTVTCIAGKCYDWVELYNGSGAALDLSGYTVTDDLTDPDKYTLSGSLKAGGYLVLYATNGTVTTNKSYIQLPFNLDSEGGVFALFAPDGALVDAAVLGGIPMDVSRGRAEGQAGFVYFDKPTKGKANGGVGYPLSTPLPTAKTAGGIYDGVSSVTVAFEGQGTLYYTLDGNEPTAASQRYSGPFELTATTAVRVMAVDADSIPSDTLTVSYIINENHTMDVVSLVSPPDGLFSKETGIYSLGNAADTYPYTGANFWKNWERAAHIELLCRDDEPGFSVDCGIRIFGGMSRMYEKKALAVKFRDSYGCGTLEYPVFDSREAMWYESLLLRCSGQDRLRTVMKDVAATSLIDTLDSVEVQAYRPVILYINGEYWGIYYIREKIDENFLSAHANVSADSVDLLQGNSGVNAGSNKEYLALLDYIKKNDLSRPDVYKYVTDRVDVQSFADYLISQIYFANNDAGNVRFYRSSDENSDGKWRWIIYDTDLCWAPSSDRIWYLINPAGTGAGQNFNTTMINGLLESDDFRALFLERLEYLMKNVYTTERVVGRVDELYNLLKPEIRRNFDRWNPKIDWETNVQALRNFAKSRQKVIMNEFLNSARVRNAFGYTEAQIKNCFEEGT